ncbi:MAG: hypothetical protein QME96_04805, partial [Myxococcota bacterium]|nr:hypothetical protein [Myxococcota bacterium]
MRAPDPSRMAPRKFETKIVVVLLAALGVTSAAAVLFFDAGLSSSFGLILQPAIGDGLETAKDRTRAHIEALREQIKWRTERIASEIRQRGPESRLPANLQRLLERLAADDAAAFERPGGPEAAQAETSGILVDASAIDATGRRIHVRRPEAYPEDVWRLKTFRPRPPADRDADRAPADA